MAWPRDVSRLIRGVGLVAQEALQLAQPALRRGVGRTSQHTKDLLNSVAALNRAAATYGQDASADGSNSEPGTRAQPTMRTPPPTPRPAPPAPPPEMEGLRQSARQAERQWVESRVPAQRLERVWGFGGLAARLMVDVAKSSVSGRGGDGGASSGGGGLGRVSDAGADALAATLCRMRGAALKLGQMLSIQDENLLPEPLARALKDVRTSANVMPNEQLFAQLQDALGAQWREHVGAIDETPLAAASIGQVHRTTLPCGTEAVLKVQYPGVADSIESDLSNLQWLIAPLAPRGLFIENIIRVAREELAEECDYECEARYQQRYQALVQQSGLDDVFLVPRVHEDLARRTVLATDFVDGTPFESLLLMPQEERNRIARAMLELTVRELFEWHFMQTDPNWGNYMYEPDSGKVVLLDFGACREYAPEFCDEYFDIVWSAATSDTATLLAASQRLGFLTGEESEEMRAAHVRAGLVVGEPFQKHAPFDFAQSNLTARLGDHARSFMKGRLTPPPREIYSLHRKLAGAFLACIKLRAVIPCRDILEAVAQDVLPRRRSVRQQEQRA